MYLPHYNGFYHFWNANKPRRLRQSYFQLLQLEDAVCADMPEDKMDAFIVYALAAERLSNESAHHFYRCGRQRGRRRARVRTRFAARSKHG